MNRCRQNGYVLITSLILLVVITLLGVSAVSNVTLQERMASNMNEKQRAFEAASIALREGEMFLRNSITGPTSLPTNQPLDINAAGIDARVASNPTYTIAEVAVRGISGEITPATQMGKRGNAVVVYYSVTAAGTGGNASAYSLLQSIYGRIY